LHSLLCDSEHVSSLLQGCLHQPLRQGRSCTDEVFSNDNFDGNSVIDVDQPNASDIRSDKLSRDFLESPFYSFSIIDYEHVVRSSKDVHPVVDGDVGPQRLVIRDKSYLAVTQGKGFKGPYYCSEMLRSVFLPGDRYFLFNVPYCGNYKGQLLIDTLTGKYQRLPAHSVVYLTLNTDTYPRYRVTGGGIVVKR
jgi:hypothetical protein